MEHSDSNADKPHFNTLVHDAAWIADERTQLDDEHVDALARMGFGFAGGRFLLHTN